MGTAAFGGKGLKERTRVSGDRPIGAASLRQHSIQASCHPPIPHSTHTLDNALTSSSLPPVW
jgi:hypothetical protein